MADDKKSLALALSIQKAAKKKYAAGGEVKDPAAKDMRESRMKSWPSPVKDEPIVEEHKPVTIDVPKAEPQKMSKGGMADHEHHYDSIADAILRKKKMAEGGEVQADMHDAPSMSPDEEGMTAQPENYEDDKRGSILDEIMSKRMKKRR